MAAILPFRVGHPVSATAHAVPAQCTAKLDTSSVMRVVGDYARRIGCDDSNRQAAIAWAMRRGRNTMDACVAGKQRADALLFRQPRDPEPPRGAA